MRSKTAAKNRKATIQVGKRYGSRRYTCLFKKENRGYVVRCVELDITSQGDTLKRAKKNIQEAINLYLESYKPSTKSLGTGERILYRKIDQHEFRKGR